MLAAPLGRCQNQSDSRLQTLLESPEPTTFLLLRTGNLPSHAHSLSAGQTGTCQRAETPAHGGQTPPVLGTEEALVEPMLLARDTMLPLRAFSMKSAGRRASRGQCPTRV